MEEMIQTTSQEHTAVPEQKTLQPTTAADLVESAHMSATAVLIAESDEVKEEILRGAEQVVHNKTEAIKNKAEMEAKKALFDNNRDACGCFGFEEATTERWAVNFMKLWNRMFTFVWILVGSVTFAPVLFIAGKLKAIIKRAWVAVLLSIVIYAAAALSPLWIHLIEEVRGLK